LDCVYKLQEYAGRARRKRSEGKATWPGRKQVFRHYDAQGVIAADVLTLADDRQEGTALIRPFVVAGKRLAPPTPLQAVRERVAEELTRLPGPARQLEGPAAVPVKVSAALGDLARSVDEHS
jgi:nicotinate phosphoribosyltransferase